MISPFELQPVCAKVGRLIKGNSVCVTVDDDGLKVGPSGKRWWAVAGRTGVGVFLLILTLSLFVFYVFVFPAGLTKVMVLCVLLAVCGVPSVIFIRSGLRLAFCTGHVLWARSGSDVVIRYGGLFRGSEIRVAKDSVVLKAYLNKVSRSDLKLGYGDYVISVVNALDDADELIVAVLTKELEFRKAAELLKEVLPGAVEYDGGRKRWIKRAGSGRADVEGWDKLVDQCGVKPFFRGWRIVADESDERIVIRWGWGKPVSTCLGFAFGVFILVAALATYMTRGLGELGQWIMFLPMGGFLFFMGIRNLRLAQRIVLNRLSGDVEVRYGLLPFAKHVTLFKEQLEVRLNRCEMDRAGRSIPLGHTVLSLAMNKTDAEELVLSCAKLRGALSDVYERMARYLGQVDEDQAICELELADGRSVCFSSAANSGDMEGSNRELVFASDEIAVFRGKARTVGIWIGCVLMGGFMIWAPIGLKDKDEISILLLLGLPMGGFMLLAGLYLIGRFVMERYLIADKKKDLLSVKSHRGRFGYSKDVGKLSNAAAVQLCSVTGMVGSGMMRGAGTVYEVNVVCFGEDDDRYTVCCGSDRDKIWEDAQRFAEFLGVEVVDHRDEMVG